MLPAICAVVAMALAATPAASSPQSARRAGKASAATSSTQRTAPRPGGAARARPASQLDRARAQLAEVKRDPAKRRYRDRWERAIAALEKAAHGRDRGPALLEAARARYALYRFSQVDADREAAVALARKADRAGAREGATLARAIRKEMGEEEPPRRPARVKPAPRGDAAASDGATAQRPAGSHERSPSGPAERRSAEVVRRKAPAAPRPAPRPPAAEAPDEPAEPAQQEATAAPAAADGARPQRAPPDEEGSIDDALAKALAEEGEAAPAAESAPAEPARVADVKTWTNHDYTRVAVYLSRSVEFRREDLPASPGQPRRVALDLSPARVARPLAHEVGDALVKRVRTAQLDGRTVRVVLDLAGEEDLTVFALQDPPRLILDVGAAAPSHAPEVATAPARPSAPAAEDGATARPEPSELLPRGRIRRIIVDAGHGGHDTGAIGPKGVREKDVTLAMARRVARQLESRGFEVVLTRTDDRYVAVEERPAIANARHGDLFVSLHANAHPRRDRHGVETYVLNVTDDRYAARLAARENGALGDGAADIPVLRRILSDLDAKVSTEASRRLAVAVQREICAGVRGRIGDVRDLGVKSALFYVLLGARMPAVLVETGFISNRVEEGRLRSVAYQDEVASAVVRAVESFATREARIASAR